jgi:hypothetical protein
MSGWDLLGWSCGSFAAFIVAIVTVVAVVAAWKTYRNGKNKNLFDLSMRDTREPRDLDE